MLLVKQLIKPINLDMRCATSGFTLIELLVAAAASLILIGIAFSSLVTFQQMSNKVDDKLIQEAELQRALRFISRDIQEGKSVERNPPKLNDEYEGVFKVVSPDNSIIGYYTARSTRDWSGPQIIYRRDFNKAKSYALIDQISNHKPTNCPSSSGTLVESGVGFSVRINSENTKATLCLVGAVDSHKDVPNDVIEASIQAAARAR